MLKTISEVTLGGGGSANIPGLTYERRNAYSLKGQADASDVRQANFTFNSEQHTGVIALDSNGNDISASTDLIALPCPSWCSSGDFDSFTAFRTFFLSLP